MTGSGPAPLRAAVLLLLCGLMVLHALHFFQPVDDAFISFRYAENVAAGRGWVFNAGERVEGYSNFLWVAILAACRGLGASIPAASRVLGLLFSLATLLTAASLARKVFPSSALAGLPAALLLCASPAMAMWAGGGMEVPLFSFLAILASRLWVAESEGRGIPWRWPLAACLAAMTRPDGVLLFGIALVWDLLAVEGEGGGRWRRMLAGLGIFAAAGIPYFLWRWTYYGALLPNTYYAKVNHDPGVAVHGLHYLGWFLLDSAGAAIALGALLAIRPRDRRISLLLWQGAGFTLYVILIGGDGYAYGRFLVPPAVLLAPAAEFGYRRAWRWIMERVLPSLSRLRPAPALLLLAVAGAGAAGSFTGADYRDYTRGVEAESRRRAIGEWLRQNAPPGALVALNPAGMIPFVSELPTLDLLGLTDAHIARKGTRVTNPVLFAHNRFDPGYVLSRRPDVLILGQATTLDVDPRLEDLTRPGPATFDAITPAVVRDFRGFPGDEAIWGMPRFRRHYTPTIARIGESYFYYFSLDRRVGEAEVRIEAGRGAGGDHALLARILAAKGEMAEALKEAEKAAAIDPGLASVRREVEEAAVATREASGRRDRTLEILRRTEEDLARGDLAAAERKLLSGLEADPRQPLLLYGLGALYERMSRPDEAMDAYRRALEARPDFADACNNLGALHARRGELERAREYWERALAIDPAHAAGENLRRLRREEGNAPR